MCCSHLMSVKIVPHDSQAPCPQQVSVHQLLAGLNVAAQPHTHKGQVLTHGEEVTALQETWLTDGTSNGHTCTQHSTAQRICGQQVQPSYLSRFHMLYKMCKNTVWYAEELVGFMKMLGNMHHSAQ